MPNKNIKIISWNVNGIRAVLKKGFLDFILKEDPDIFCLQETKAEKSQVELTFPEEYKYHYWNSAEKKGYAGTAIFSKIKPLKEIYGMGIVEHDKEGRVLTLEYDNYYLVNVYTPNAKRELERLSYKQKWDSDFLVFLKKLEKTKPVIFLGDLNVAHKEIDIARPKDNLRSAGFTVEEREDFSRIIDSGFIDTFRKFNKDPGNYTWWSYMFHAREKNIGWRIDYICISKALEDKLKSASILNDVMGSDHCPVTAEFKF